MVENKELKQDFMNGLVAINLIELDTLEKSDNFVFNQIRYNVFNKDEVENYILYHNNKMIYVEDYDREKISEISILDYIKEVPSFVEFKDMKEAKSKYSLKKLFNMGLISVHTSNKEEYNNLLGFIEDDEVEIGTIWNKNTNIIIRGSKVSYTSGDNYYIVEYKDFIK